ncbi:hypothetical protein [Ruegeria sp.]|uniref:hypothetical protein n=1 Tax=Ruegeria sp. TaxID=1879320 RepID=UPI003C7EA015
MFNLVFLVASVTTSIILATIFIEATDGAAGWVVLGVFGILLGIANVFVFPRFFGLPVSKPHVDITYYALGMAGIILFFEADRLDRKVAELRQSALSNILAVNAIEDEIEAQKVFLSAQRQDFEEEIELLQLNEDILMDLSKGGDASDSDLAKRIVQHVQKAALERANASATDGDPFEQSLLKGIAATSSIAALVQFHNQAPRQAFEVRKILAGTEEYFPPYARNCVFENRADCQPLYDQLQYLQTYVKLIAENIESLENERSFVFRQLFEAKLKSRDANAAYLEFTNGVDGSPSFDDPSQIEADRYRHSFWPYAIISAFTLKLASADSSRITEALSRKVAAAKAYLNYAMNEQRARQGKSKALQRSIRGFHRRFRRSGTLEEVKAYLEAARELISEADAAGEIDISDAVYSGCIEFLRNALPVKSSVAGLVARGDFLEASGDFWFGLERFEDARDAYTECIEDRKSIERRTLSDEAAFDHARCILKLCISEAGLENHTAATSLLDKLQNLEDELDSDYQKMLREFKARARRVLSGFPSKVI